MKKLMIAALMVIAIVTSVKAQFGNQNYACNDDRYYYDNDFDWHWDIRVKISNGVQRGLLTRNESNRLYEVLEDVERKEYAYQADGFFDGWEQQAVWNDVVYLNQRLGIELSDYDRNFYGFDGYDRHGYNQWFNQGGYDFFRFDKRGFGSMRLGYNPRPNYNGWCRNNNNFTARRYYSERPYIDNRRSDDREYARGNWGNGNNGNRYGRDSRKGNDYNRNRNDNDRNNSQGNYDNRRNDRIEMPNNRLNNNGNGFPNIGGKPERIEPNNNGNSFPNVGGRPERTDPNGNNSLPQRNNGGLSEKVEIPISRPTRVEPPQGNNTGRLDRTDSNNGSENGNRNDANSHSEAPQSGGNRGGQRGPR